MLYNILKSIKLDVRLVGNIGMSPLNESKIKKETNQKYKIIFTGGLAHLFKKDTKDKIIIDKNLTINGLIKVSKYFNL